MKYRKHNELHLKSHDRDHAHWDRRGFLRTLGMAGAGAISFGNSTLSVVESPLLNQALSDAYSDRILVLIRLKGGNDGLNTIVPLNDFDLYANKRPNIHIPENKLYKLNDNFAMPNFMNSIAPMWGDGAMKIKIYLILNLPKSGLPPLPIVRFLPDGWVDTTKGSTRII